MRMIAAFEKTERVRHIGHLDLMRAMQRALRRSGLPIRYSQGFNPHVVLSFASPLPVGVSGARELMDIALEVPVEDALFAAELAPALPASMPLIAVRAIDDRHPKLMAALQTAAYTATLPRSDASLAMVETIPALLARKEIIALRKTKSGEKPCDIRPMIHELNAVENAEAFRFSLRVSLTEAATLKPGLLLDALAAQAGVETPPFRLRREMLFGQMDGAAVPLMEI